MKSEFDGAKVLITGGLGFVGSNLALFNLAGQTSHLDSMRNPMPDAAALFVTS